MSTYRLISFDCRARAEAARYIMAVGDIDYDDVRLNLEEWKALKPSMPFGQLPVLEVDGVKIAQTRTIFRFLAKRAGLAGRTDMDEARIDMMAECAEEIGDVGNLVVREMGDRAKARARGKAKTMLQGILGKIENLRMSHGGHYLTGDNLTWADLVLKANLDGPMVFNHIEVNMEEFPHLAELLRRIDAHPKIAHWMARRPVTDF